MTVVLPVSARPWRVVVRTLAMKSTWTVHLPAGTLSRGDAAARLHLERPARALGTPNR